ncbi:hypothetical protein AJ85_00535 [Alkalihalobacillus alcalophilus ATCC 27647 = CGMCC 1.3604]|uniref:Uncharacterized protein n=1 Tax=Alkalihalobacillus alcalophilus ATCC 27647 = CGMCC 1.3604 TaxID=1218173 RepID=A0A4S4JYL2_ALKAL|nr:hypothetical protein AJ85_00535 [Alkalihalobacillus alcalophilus ATCC 27647 = CGMCC 1.3604]
MLGIGNEKVVRGGLGSEKAMIGNEKMWIPILGCEKG